MTEDPVMEWMTPFHRGKGVFPTPSGLLGLLYIALGFVGIIIVSSNSCSFGDDTENRLSGPRLLSGCLLALFTLFALLECGGVSPRRANIWLLYTTVLQRYCTNGTVLLTRAQINSTQRGISIPPTSRYPITCLYSYCRFIPTRHYHPRNLDYARSSSSNSCWPSKKSVLFTSPRSLPLYSYIPIPT